MNLISQTSDSKSLVLNQCQFTYLIKYKEKLTHGTSIYCFTNASGMINLWNCLLKSDVLFYETNNVSLYPPPFYISGRTRFPLVSSLLPVHREPFSEQSVFKSLFHEHFIEQIKPLVHVSFNTLFSVAIF